MPITSFVVAVIHNRLERIGMKSGHRSDRSCWVPIHAEQSERCGQREYACRGAPAITLKLQAGLQLAFLPLLWRFEVSGHVLFLAMNPNVVPTLTDGTSAVSHRGDACGNGG